MRSIVPFFVLLALANPAPASEPGARILFIVDASASMVSGFGTEGGDRIGAVRNALDTTAVVLRNFEIEPTPELAIRTFGSQLSFIDPESCSDSELILDWSAVPYPGVGSAMDNLSPKGQNALGQALMSAAGDLGQTGSADLIIVILDDLDACEENVDQLAENLTRDGDGATLVVLGIGLPQLDKVRASGWSIFRAPKSPAALASEVVGLVSNHLGLSPPDESTYTQVSYTLNNTSATSFAELSVVGHGAVEALDLPLSNNKKMVALGLGNATVMATDESGETVVEVNRIPVFPGRDLAIDVPIRLNVEIEESLSPSGWGILPEVTFSWNNAPEGDLRATFSAPDAPPTTWWASAAVSGPSGTVTFPIPDGTTAGRFRLLKRMNDGFEVAAETTVSTYGRAVDLKTPTTESVHPGTLLNVAWEAVAAPGDILTIVPADSPLEIVADLVYAEEGSPSELVVPPDLCDYEIRYLAGDPYRVIARSHVQPYAPLAGLLFPEEVPAAGDFVVRWWGPENVGNVITISSPGSGADDYLIWEDLSSDSPARMTAPRAPGEFEVRFVSRDDDILAVGPLVVTEVSARLWVPDKVRAGRRFAIDWEGPAGANDFLALVPAGQPLHLMKDFAYVSSGSPTSLAAPSAAGSYEVRYVAEDPRRELAWAPIEVVD